VRVVDGKIEPGIQLADGWGADAGSWTKTRYIARACMVTLWQRSVAPGAPGTPTIRRWSSPTNIPKSLDRALREYAKVIGQTPIW